MLNYACFSMLILLTGLVIRYTRGNVPHYHFHLKNNAPRAGKRSRTQNPRCIADARPAERIRAPSSVSRESLEWKFNLDD